jgi:hypothetical protein
MKNKILCIFVSILLFFSFIGTISSANSQKKTIDPEPINPDYSHTIFGEYFTATTCVPCKYTHQALKELFAAEYHPFYYITYVFNKNAYSKMRKTELQVVGTPTVIWDGGYEKDTILYNASVEIWKTKLNESILSCGARDVKDIDLTLDVEWLGAVNNHPEDGETLVPIEVILNWTVTEMVIDLVAKNNEASEYDGHIHIQITENESSFWDDKFDNPYTLEFKNYAFNDDVTLDSGETWSKTINWDGMDYDDGGGDNWDPHIFDYITQENIWVIATIMDKDENKWVDETAGFRAGEEGTDPKTFDVYFGDSYPPNKIISNGTANKYDPSPFGDLNWSTTYYWKVDVWNAKGEKTPGDDLTFTTRGNSPPNPLYAVNPINGSTDAPIDTNLIWIGGDPDGDDVLYDIYFGKHDPNDPWTSPCIEYDWELTEYDPSPLGPLDFDTEYEWRIIAEDDYGEITEGDWWWFKTESNYPPNPAEDPNPEDGEQNVPVNASLFWNGSDPNSGDTLYYDVYFGLDNPPKLQEHNQTESTYDPDGDMELYKEYYWKIVTWDKSGERSENNKIWTFSTGINLPPSAPEIDGPTKGKPDIVYNFTFVSIDPENNTIKYVVDWDDGSSDETILYENGTVVPLSHSWKNRSKYTITAIAIDKYGARSDLSSHVINIPRNRAINNNHLMISWLLERFPNLFPLLRYILGLK